MYTLLKIGIPFIYLERTLCLFVLLLNAPSLKRITKTQEGFLAFSCKISPLALLKVLLQTEMTDFPPVIGHYWEYPLEYLWPRPHEDDCKRKR